MFNLFEDSGKVIKILAKVQFFLAVIFGFFLPLFLDINAESFFVEIIIYFAIVFGCAIIGFFNTIFIYAFGEIVDSSKTTTTILYRIDRRLEKLEADNNAYTSKEDKEEITKEDVKEEKAKTKEEVKQELEEIKKEVKEVVKTQKPNNTTNVKPNANINETVEVHESNGFIICPKCGKKQKSDRTCCFICGAHFEHK